MIRVCKTRYGSLMVEDNDRYLARSLIEMGEFAEFQVELFRVAVQPGMVVVDVGANIGAHTLAFARMGAFVHAYEPQRDVFHMLCGNVALNRLRNVHCHHQAVGSEPGHIGIPTMDLNEAGNNIGAFSIDLEGDITDFVEVVRLEQPCHFLKIDVEGFELEVLKGATDMIRACHPMIYVENDRREKSKALLEYIRALGYTPYWHITDLDNPDNFNRKALPVIGCQSVDLMCTPPGETLAGVLPEALTEFHEDRSSHDRQAA